MRLGRLLLAFALFFATAARWAAAEEAVDEVRTLQQRLTDAGCYQGAIDGVPNPATDAAIKACPDMKPFLRIETGMHVAQINHVGVDGGCRRLATSSDDKTIRIWSLPDGKLEQTIRLPIGEGDSGKIFAASLSPDGKTLAAGGWDGHREFHGDNGLYVVELDNRAVRRFGVLPNVILSLAFSPNGESIAVGLAGNNGVRIFSVATGLQTMADVQYADGVYALAFGADGALFAAGLDGQLRRYGNDGKLLAKSGALAGRRPASIAVSPDDARLALGFNDTPKVEIIDTRNLKRVRLAQTSDVDSKDLSAVAWSHDGSQFVAGGGAYIQTNGDGRNFIRRFSSDGRQLGADTPVALNTIQDIRTCGDAFLFASADPSFGLLMYDGVARVLQGPHGVDLRGKVGDAFTVSSDGERVRFGLGLKDAQSVMFDLAASTLTDEPRPLPDLAAARVAGLSITEWLDSDHPKLAGSQIALDDYETSRALSVRADRRGFTLATDFLIRAFDSAGRSLWRRPGPGIAWGINASADDKLIVVAYGDGTIRWLRGLDGEELLSLFVEPQTRKWVAWTPSGYYMASAGGEDLHEISANGRDTLGIGWHLNRGWSQLADFIPAAQFREKYNRPDVVKLVLKTLDESEALKRANEAARRTPSLSSRPSLFPPVATIRSPAEGAEITDGKIALAYELRSLNGLSVDNIDVLIDGQPVAAQGFDPSKTAGTLLIDRPEAAKAKVTLIAHAGGLASAPVGVDLAFPAPSTDARPKLYALLVGVTGYKDHDLDDIRFAGRDAEGFAEALKRQKGGLYADVEVRILDVAPAGAPPSEHPGPPTREHVFEGFNWLKQNATKGNLSLVYLSGHGFNDVSNSKFWFLTQETNFDLLETTAVSGDELLARLRGLKGKKLLFIDACYSGAALAPAGAKSSPMDIRPNMDELINDFTVSDTGIVAYAAAQAREKAWEKDEFDKHGAFGKALIEAFGEGRGAIDGQLTTDLLDRYLTDRVMELTRKAQHPVANRPQPVPDFPVALVR